MIHSMRLFIPAVIGALASVSSVRAASFVLAQNYSGPSFFDAWTFISGPDPGTVSNVLYLPRDQATETQLAYVNSAGHAIIRVDNITNGVGNMMFGRPSVKIASNATVSAGSLVLMDAFHLPFGCSVWPAFWMEGPNWPNNGEIDIVENANLNTNNRYALHTTAGCTHPAASASGGTETGSVITTDCIADANNTGCIVQDASASSYGAGFAAAGGGAFAMLWDSLGIRMWFFPRSTIPADLAGASPDPSGWGQPAAFYPTDSCDMSKFFGPQTLTIDINVCGTLAGFSNFDQTCSGVCTDVVGVNSTYNDAWFDISYVRVFNELNG